MIVKQQVKHSPLPLNWKKEESVYTGDQLIDAYLKGKREGKDEMMKTLTNQFQNNMAIATSVSEKLYDAAEKENINFKTIHVKAEGISKFSALVVAKKEDILADEFREILRLARKLKNEVESDSFYMSFSFVPYSNELNDKLIVADGFFLKYEKE